MKRLVFAALTLALLWLGGLVLFVSTLPDGVQAPERHTDAIVVVTGGSERLAEGIRLLIRGMAQKLFISGVNAGSSLSALIASLPPETEKPSSFLMSCCITAGHAADSTLGNAAETAAWMKAEGFQSLRLVTADYHMPRSLLEFRRAMPDMEIIAHPVFPDQVRREAWWRSPGTASLLIGEYDKYLFARLRAALHGAPAADGPKTGDGAAAASGSGSS
jgi:uncharacterized SAM-binding protein YcdF (DUF218 family)